MLSKRFSQLNRLFAVLVFSYFLASCGDGDGPTPVYDTASPPPPSEAYTLVWSDEFDVNGAPNVKNWRIEEGFGVNNEWQLYTDVTEDDPIDPTKKNNLRVEGGNLIITARCSYADPEITDPPDPGKCNSAGRDGAITSARINTNDKLEVKYGNIQARIKMPPGKGTWPAFWMLGAEFPEKPWPRAGEIDIVEVHQFYSDINTTHFAMHWCDDSIPGPVPCEFVPGRVFEEQYKKFDFALSDDYHVFEADWDENRVVGKIDGNAYFSFPIDPATREEFLSKFFMILNVAVGGDLGGPPNDSTTWPQEMLVDWVRVYEKNQPDVVELVPDETASPFTYENFVRIVNSVEFGGDSVVSTIQRTVSEDDEKFNDITPPAVTPLTGNTIVEFDYESANTFFSGAAFLFNQKDITHYEKIVFSLDTSMFPNLAEISIEMNDNRFTGDGAPGKISIPLSTYTPVATSGNWESYEIPLTAFVGVNLDNVASWGFWNPKEASGQLIAGKLYLDDIRLVSVPCTANGVVSFSSDTIAGNSSSTQISVTDACLANKNETVVVVVDNGTESIGVSVPIIASGLGIGTVNFGPTKDASSTIAITEGTVLTASYTDTNGVNQTDTANVSTAPLAVYSETKTDNVLVYTGITNENTVTNEASAAVTALEGSVSLQSDFSVPGSGENGFAFDFPDTSSGLLVNGSFEADDASGATLDCTAGAVSLPWQCFNPAFVLSNANGAEPGPLAHGGSQVLLTTGDDGLAQQSVVVNAGEQVNVSAYAMNWADQKFDDGSLAVLELTFWDAGNVQINRSAVEASTVGDKDYTLTQKPGTAVTDWTKMEISAVAPAGAVRAQVLMIHIIAAGTSASAVFWDDVSLTVDSSSEVSSDISYYQTLTFGINKAASGLMDLEVRMQDAASNVATVFLSDYMPTAGAVAGWDIYQIPVANFTGLDLTDIRALGFYNASSTVSAPPTGSVTYFATTLYIDDVHFALNTPAVLTGVLVNSPIEGATFSTATQSGITNALGEFQYLPGEDVTFTIGDIDLGTVPGAPVVTPVELTGSVNPTDQAATNQLVFLQSIDADQDPSNGITISAATQAAAVGQTLDFTLDSAAFTTAISGPTGVVNTIAPGNAVVTETDAVNNYYTTFPPTASAASTTINVVPGTVDADGMEASTITVQAKDSSGNDITASAGLVTLTSTGNAVVTNPVIDNTDGTYTATVTNTTAESVIITGTIDGNPITTGDPTVFFVGAVDLFATRIDAPSNIEADDVTKTTVTVQLRDVNDNNLVKGAGIVALTIIESIPDNSASFDNGTQATTATNNGDGTYTAYVKNSQAEDVTIAGTIAGTVTGAFDDDVTVRFIVGAASGATTTISAVASAAVNNGSNTGIRSTITVQAKDAGGNNITVGGDSVNLTITEIVPDNSASFDNGTNATTANDNSDGTYTAYVRNTAAETITIEGTIGGNTIVDNATTVLFGNTVGVSSETNIDSPLYARTSAFNDAACDQTVVLDDSVPTGTGAGEHPSYEGTVSGEVAGLPAIPGGTNNCVGIVFDWGPGTGAVPAYSSDFESPLLADMIGNTDIEDFVIGNIINGGAGWFPNTFGAPANYNNGYSAIVSGEGDLAQGDQQLSIFADYNDFGPFPGNPGVPIETFVYREPGLFGAGDEGVTYRFSFDAKLGNIDPALSQAKAYVKVLEFSTGTFNELANIAFDSDANLTVNWSGGYIDLLVDTGMVGELVQIGFTTTATDYSPSGVFYDNLDFSPLLVDLTGYATLKFAFDASGVTGAAFADMELRMEDGNGGVASVYLSDYTPVPANPAIASADWQLYEIPLADFTGTLDKTNMKSLTFADPSSSVIPVPGPGVTPLEGTIRTDDIHFIETP